MNEFSEIISTEGWIILQLVLAALFGGLIGGERQAHGRPAGLRTHILVCLGSTAVIIAFQQLQMNLGVGAESMIRMDPARVAAGIITGIGFLGAGTIIKGKDFVMGLTTAASLWVVAAIGIGLGLGEYFLAVVVTVLVLLTLYILDKINIPSDNYAELSLEGENIIFDDILSRLTELGLQVKGYHMGNDLKTGLRSLNFVVRFKDEMVGPRVIDSLSSLDRLTKISWK